MQKNCARVILLGICVALFGCGQNTGITLNATPGQCPNGPPNAPYCMGIKIINSGGGTGGQQWITSTNFPISNFSLSINGATNILSPATSTTTDPNNCAGTNVAPGSSCTFYLKISNEAYSTLSTEDINVTLSYNVKNQLFGPGETQSTSFTVYEVTNLYAISQNGYINIVNSIGSTLNNTSYYAESNDILYSSAVDTNSYGFLYLGGGLGIYQVGGESGTESTSTSISPSSFSGVTNNLFTQASNLYASPLGSNSPTIWNFSLSNQTWGANATYQLGNTSLVNNANTISPSGVIYLASANQVFSCGVTTTGGTSTSCATEGPSTAAQGSITSIAFPNSGATPYTGLYIGTGNGLYAESGSLGTTSNNNTWAQVNQGSLSTPVPPINIIATYNGTLFAGDTQGNIWQIESSSATSASVVATLPGAITAIGVDSVANVMYIVSNNTLYGWVIGSSNAPTSTGVTFSSPIIGLNIASQLVSSI